MKPDCSKCKHFFVTFNPVAPRGCRIYGIQTSSIPTLVVKKANGGAECIGFEQKLDKKPKEKDLNDSRYWKA